MSISPGKQKKYISALANGRANTARFGNRRRVIRTRSSAAHEFEFVPIRRKGERSPAK